MERKHIPFFKKRFWKLSIPFLLAGILIWPGVNLYYLLSTRTQMAHSLPEVRPAQAALLLGARVYRKNRVSQIVYDRIVKSVELYRSGKVRKILISGDHGTVQYDEVNTIKARLLSYHIPARDIFMDHAGFSTYESVYRAREIFRVKSMIIVTQGFHLPRALFLARRFGIQAQGFAADRIIYRSRHYNAFRESLARVKDLGFALLRPPPTYLGKTIPITGDGRITQD